MTDKADKEAEPSAEETKRLLAAWIRQVMAEDGDTSCSDRPNPERRVRVILNGKPCSFKTNRIERLESTQDPNVTLLRLIAVNTVGTVHEGFYLPTVTVYMPHDKLDAKIYGSKASLVDLTPFCARPVPTVRGVQIGAKVDERSYCAGISPDTHELMYVAKKDLTATFYGAKRRARKLSKKTGQNWRLSSENETLIVLRNRSLLPNFNDNAYTRLHDSHYMTRDKTVIQASGHHRKSSMGRLGRLLFCKFPARLVRD